MPPVVHESFNPRLQEDQGVALLVARAVRVQAVAPPRATVVNVAPLDLLRGIEKASDLVCDAPATSAGFTYRNGGSLVVAVGVRDCGSPEPDGRRRAVVHVGGGGFLFQCERKLVEEVVPARPGSPGSGFFGSVRA